RRRHAYGLRLRSGGLRLECRIRGVLGPITRPRAVLPRRPNGARPAGRAGASALPPAPPGRVDPRLPSLRLWGGPDGGRRRKPAGPSAAVATPARDAESGRDGAVAGVRRASRGRGRGAGG